MDGIQIQRGSVSPARHSGSLEPAPIGPTVAKTTSDYVGALKRKIWLVLGIAIPLAVLSAIMILKMPAVYQAKTEIEIRPPEIDPHLSTLVGHEVGGRDPGSLSMFVANHEVWLKSRWLADLVVSDPAIAPLVSNMADPAAELFRTLSVLRNKMTNSFLISLDGSDPVLTKKLLDTLLVIFQTETKFETERKLDSVLEYAKQSHDTLMRNQVSLTEEITRSLEKSRLIGPNGRSLIEEQYTLVGSMLAQRQLRQGDLSQQMQLASVFPKFDAGAESGASRIAQLEAEARKYGLVLERLKRTVRQFNTDPAALEWSARLNETLDELEKLRSIKTKVVSTPYEMIMEQNRREIEAENEEHEKLLAQMQAAVPEYQRIQTLMSDRTEKAHQLAKIEERIKEFEILKQSLVSSECVRLPKGGVSEPTVPIKPNRMVLIVLSLMASLGLGVGVVCLLEHVDQTVRVPEHVTHGMGLPLLGVVPRIRRTALTQRGNHLWTQATPYSLEADAYRNIRAALLGVSDHRGPMVTLLVTSPQVGDGKSTTSLNLAATCARAGERTLLLDVDLRRPSLAEALIDGEPLDQVHGLVDVLRGELPWQRTVRSTELPNLDFIPTGDPRSVPIEILGTLELKQLLVAVSGHYDRVILDGPAVLGLADCRVLGRLVDAALVVVRSGAHQLMTLNRAKTILEQSRVAIAGVVFNGLVHDIADWASYDYQPVAIEDRVVAAIGASRSREPEPAGMGRGGS